MCTWAWQRSHQIHVECYCVVSLFYWPWLNGLYGPNMVKGVLQAANRFLTRSKIYHLTSLGISIYGHCEKIGLTSLARCMLHDGYEALPAGNDYPRRLISMALHTIARTSILVQCSYHSLVLSHPHVSKTLRSTYVRHQSDILHCVNV